MTTEVDEIMDQILVEFMTEWSDHLPVEYENLEGSFTVPETGSWVRFRVDYNDTIITSMQQKGKRRFHRYGLVTYWIFCPLNAGTYDGSAACIKINNIFEGESIGEVDFTKGSWKPLGSDGQWYQFNGKVEWSYDQIK